MTDHLSRFLVSMVQDSVHQHVVIAVDPAPAGKTLKLVEGKQHGRTRRRKTQLHSVPLPQTKPRSPLSSASHAKQIQSILKKPARQNSFDSDLSGGHESSAPPRPPRRAPASPVLKRPQQHKWSSSASRDWNPSSFPATSRNSPPVSGFDATIVVCEKAASPPRPPRRSTLSPLVKPRKLCSLPMNANLSSLDNDRKLSSFLTEQNVNHVPFEDETLAEQRRSITSHFGTVPPQFPCASASSYDVPPRQARRDESFGICDQGTYDGRSDDDSFEFPPQPALRTTSV
jgi:hypothetical protein